MQRYTTHSERETISCGEEFAKTLKRGDVVALYGDLGTGKTRFVQGVCKGLGVLEHVASPTFTIINEYAVADLKIYHFDFYRMTSPKEIRDVGFEEYINLDGICLVEWAEKAFEFLPPDRYDVRLELGRDEHTRFIAVKRRIAVPL